MDAVYYGLATFTVAFLVLATIKLVQRARVAPKEHTVMLATYYAVTPRVGETDEQLRERIKEVMRGVTRYPREL